MKNYTRGQETFVNRIFITIHNLIRLALGSIFMGSLGFSLLVYLWIPSQFWATELLILKQSKSHLERHKIWSIPQIVDSIKRYSLANYSIYEEAFRSCFLWGTVIAAIGFILMFFFFLKRGQKMLDPSYRRGSLLLTPKEFNQSYGKIIKNEVQEIRKDDPRRFSLFKHSSKQFRGRPFVCGQDNLALPEYCLYRHMVMVGSTGVGKSTLIKTYLEYCRQGGEKVILPDVNGEYTSEFYRPGDTILSLSDKNTAFWSFAAEQEVHASEFAKFLVPSGDERNAFWWKGARQIVRQLLEKARSAEELWHIINNESEDLAKNLSGLAKKIIGKEGSPQAAGITGSSLLDLGFLEYLNKWPKAAGRIDPFSVFDWSQNKRPGWVFITFEDTDKEMISPLLKLWLNTTIFGLFKRKSTNLPPLNIVIDEMSTVGKIELLPTALERARKYGGKVILGYQSESQLISLYGREGSCAIKANTGSKFIFRCPEADEAKNLSDFLGRQEVSQKNSGTSYGANNLNDRENISEHESLRNVVLDSEIRDLPDGHFYLKSLNINPVKSRIRKIRWPKIFACDFCPHSSATPSPPEPEAKEDPAGDEGSGGLVIGPSAIYP